VEGQGRIDAFGRVKLGVALAAAGLAAGLALHWASGPPQRARNVLLVTLDTVRADALSCYGGPAETPAIDRLAAEGARFAFAHAHNVETLPSHANILTGLLPTQHGVRDNSGFVLPAHLPTLATILKARGYATAAFVAAAPLDARFGLNRGFDVYSEGYPEERGPGQLVYPERPASAVVPEALGWLRSLRDGPPRPWFCWVHLFDAHSPYEPPEPYRSRYAKSPYHGEIAALDAALAPLLELGRTEPDTLVVLTADHGESLGEHGELTHGLLCYEATLHVPLVLRATGLIRPGVREDSVGHIDILPTVLDALGVESWPDGVEGVSLLRGEAPRQRELYFEALSAMLNRGWAPLRGLLQGRDKWIELPLPERYDLASDPKEEHNLVSERSGEALHARLLQRVEGDRVDGGAPVDPEVRQRLEALGYLTGRAERKERYTEQDDPKRLIHLDADMQRAVGLYQHGRLREAMELYEGVLRKRPTMGVAYSYLAFLQHQAGDLEAAVATLKRAKALGVGSQEGQMLLAGYLTEAGRPEEAVQLLGPMLEQKDLDVDTLNVLGIALAGTGDTAKALECFERILRIDPHNGRALLNSGTVRLRTGEEAQARSLLEAAVAADPKLADGWNTLGVLEARSDRLEQAIADWKKTLEIEPGKLDTLYNLGLLLARLGRTAEARPVLERFLREAPAAAAEDRARVEQLLRQ
jgi:arylsulfatase A-like enzyme